MTLQLHNLMYEKKHYAKAIRACKDFKTKYADIELVSEEEFLRDAPLEIRSSVFSADSMHDLMLKRLNYELSQRKNLCSLRSKLELQKKALEETIVNRKKFLLSLPSQLKALKKASLPMENQLGLVHATKLKQEQLAELLPAPLYVIYSQFLSQKEAFGENIELEVTGNVKEAHTFARQLANKDSVVTTILEDLNNVPEGENNQRSGIYQSHPLRVSLHIYNDDILDLNSARLVTLNFEFLMKLNMVCVEAEDSDSEVPPNDILCNLFPDDPGLELPQQSAKLCIGDSVSFFNEQRNSRPYKWAQHLAGIEFLPEVSPLILLSGNTDSETTKDGSISSGLSLYHHQNQVQTLVQRIRAHVQKKTSPSLA